MRLVPILGPRTNERDDYVAVSPDDPLWHRGRLWTRGRFDYESTRTACGLKIDHRATRRIGIPLVLRRCPVCWPEWVDEWEEERQG